MGTRYYDAMLTCSPSGPNSHTLQQIQDAARDGLRAVKNAIEDNCLIPGAAAFHTALSAHLREYMKKPEVKGKAKMGVAAFADAMLVIPKTLARNGGYDGQDVVINIMDEIAQGNCAGIDLRTGLVMDPQQEGIWDNYRVIRNMLHSW